MSCCDVTNNAHNNDHYTPLSLANVKVKTYLNSLNAVVLIRGAAPPRVTFAILLRGAEMSMRFSIYH